MRPALKSQVLCRTLLAGACRYAAIIQEDFHDSFENLGCLILVTSELSLLFHRYIAGVISHHLVLLQVLGCFKALKYSGIVMQYCASWA